MPRLAEQIKEALAAFAGIEQPPALIGGLALAAHQVIRATEDVDFLVDGDEADRLHDILIGLGYTCIHRSENAANYVRGDEGLDLLYAHRPIARRLLQEAEPRDTAMGRLRVISAEGLIAFKLQGYVNDASRVRDLDDIRSLLHQHHASLNMAEVREYFALFDRQELLDELLAQATQPGA
ncbi:nucleotidyltransferase family protein [Luteimonas suaedae]|uniref:nucleotidyltransferase family protein n=1 Tax=Luteimonas suaedae TaxID=2605430 RepID=UPI0011EDD7CB|nr:nucleotidyltransferase family protein [Luteimonas suaedae]